MVRREAKGTPNPSFFFFPLKIYFINFSSDGSALFEKAESVCCVDKLFLLNLIIIISSLINLICMLICGEGREYSF